MLGEFAERQLLIFGVVAAIAIFLLLQTAFRSWRIATMSFLTLPMPLVGGAVAAFVGGGILSLGSLVCDDDLGDRRTRRVRVGWLGRKTTTARSWSSSPDGSSA